jgi:hypothetical protein
MVKRTLLFLALAGLVSTALPDRAVAERCIMGRITGFTPTSISVNDRETITFSVDYHTRFTKLITKGPWQQATELHAGALDIGRLVVIHSRHSDDNVARWVQVATDVH